MLVAVDTTQAATVAPEKLEFAKIYPNPAKQLLNLAYYANTTGTVEFDLIDQLGETVLKDQLGSAQNYAQFSTSNLSNGLYYWVLKDSARTIDTGKVAVIK